jgi:hypothetical protein
MHVDISTVHRNGKSYTRALLRETYRDAGKVKCQQRSEFPLKPAA